MTRIKRRSVTSSVLAVICMVPPSTAVYACTIYQGTWKVCGDKNFNTCVTPTGNGSVHGFTTSGSTSASITGGSVKTTATGLKTSGVSATYEVKYMGVA